VLEAARGKLYCRPAWLAQKDVFPVSKSRPKPATRRRSDRQAVTDEANQPHPDKP